MKIIVDAFGGDHAPLAVIESCRQAEKKIIPKKLRQEKNIRIPNKIQGAHLLCLYLSSGPAIIIARQPFGFCQNRGGKARYLSPFLPFSLKKQEKLTEPETGDKILRKRRTDGDLNRETP